MLASGTASADPRAVAVRRATAQPVGGELPSQQRLAAQPARVEAEVPRPRTIVLTATLREDALDPERRYEAISYDLEVQPLGKRTKPPGVRVYRDIGVSVKKRGVLFGRRF